VWVRVLEEEEEEEECLTLIAGRLEPQRRPSK
jgi:hypothetical protein